MLVLVKMILRTWRRLRERLGSTGRARIRFPFLVSGHGLFSFPTADKEDRMFDKSESQLLKWALVAFALAVVATIYPV